MSLHHFPIRNSLNSINFLRSFLEPLPIVQTRHLLLLALSTRTTSSYCSPFQFITSSHFTHPGKLWFNTTIVVIMVESGTAQLISATTLNSVCLTGIKPNKGALRQEKTLQVWKWISPLLGMVVSTSAISDRRGTPTNQISQKSSNYLCGKLASG